MHTIPTPELTLRDLKQTMLRLQIKALETLERLMDDQELTGNEKTDKAKATERNRQRMSATQTLIHCRTMQRELREKREQSHRIKQDERAAQQKAPHQLATLRRLHKLHPDEYNNPDAAWGATACPEGQAVRAAKGVMANSEDKTEGAGHADNCSPVEPPPPSPLEGEGGRASGRMRGRFESSDDQGAPYGGAMVGAEGAGHADLSAQHSDSHGLRPTDRRTQTMPPKPIPTDIGKALAAHIIAVTGSTRGLEHAPPHTELAKDESPIAQAMGPKQRARTCSLPTPSSPPSSHPTIPRNRTPPSRVS